MSKIAPVLQADLCEVGHQIVILDKFFQGVSKGGAVLGQDGENAACVQVMDLLDPVEPEQIVSGFSSSLITSRLKFVRIYGFQRPLQISMADACMIQYLNTQRSEKKASEFLKSGHPYQRKVQTYEKTFNFAPAKVFHQFCPTRECDWIDGWDCKLIYTSTGYVESDCIFATDESNLLGSGLCQCLTWYGYTPYWASLS